MQTDEDQIRALVDTWMNATRAGDTDTVLTLMADDVIFLRPGVPPMVGKAAFAAESKAQSGGAAPKFDGRIDIQEIRVAGNWASMWTKLSVTAAPPDGSPPVRRAGYTLTILEKRNGRWVLSRDANMLSPA